MENKTKNAWAPPSNVREFPAETLCPSCGKFVGAYEKCPYCGTALQKRMSIIFFKRAALVLAIGGLALLWFTATKIKIPVVRIADINARMNNAVVEVKGKVTRVSIMGRDGIGFDVDDGSEQLRAQAFRGLDKMRESGNVPQVGDEVSVVGSIQITEKYGTSLMINIPSRVKVIPAVPEKVTIDKVTLENKGKAVEVVGEVIAVGNEIRVVGSVDAFKGRPQVKVRNVEKIEVLKGDTIPAKEIPGYEKIREGAGDGGKPGAAREGGEGEAESQPSVLF